jgi:hypothetical protein
MIFIKFHKVLIVVFIFLVASIFVFLFGGIKEKIGNFIDSKPDNLDFMVNQCDEAISGYSDDQLGVKEVVWQDDNTLKISAYVGTYCGGEDLVYPNYSINSSDLVLKYKRTISSSVTQCVCAREIVYKISNLPKKDYTVSLMEINDK